MPLYPANWSPKKQDKKAAEARRWLVPGETVLYQFQANSSRPMATDVVVTDARVFTYAINQFCRAVLVTDITDVDARGSTIRIETAAGDPLRLTSVNPKFFAEAADAIRHACDVQAPKEVTDELARHAVAVAEGEERQRARRAAADLPASVRWSSCTVLGSPSKKATQAIQRLCLDSEEPWLVLAPGPGAGVLAAFGDRLAIVKTGTLTSFMAGSFLGERSTTFYFRDITAVEYNSGFATGVLEVLTASYQGSANKDFWRGTLKSRNADANDPFTMSNTLPLARSDYMKWAAHLQELRARISASKQAPAPVAPTRAPAPASTSAPGNLADDLAKLATLRESGVLTDEEFAAAKARLLGA